MRKEVRGMARISKNSSRKQGRAATTPEGRENQLISLAFDLVEKKMLDGSASAAETVHFLKLGSSRERLEQKRLENENLLLSAKVDALASAKRVEELYAEALNAMRTYSGQETEFGYMDDFDDFDEP
jgi:hypothetical protein